MINTQDNPYSLSIEIESTGYVEGNLTAKETSLSEVIQNPAMLGTATELKCEESTCNIENVVLKFKIAEDYTDNVLGLFSDIPELQGVKRLTVFKYFEDTNMFLPIETYYDEETNTIYTEVDELGTYCVMDLEIWLSNMGIADSADEQISLMSLNIPDDNTIVDEENEFTEEETRIVFSEDSIDDSDFEDQIAPAMFYTNKINKGAVTVQTPIDVVFLLQQSGTTSWNFTSQKDMIKTTCENLFNAYSDVRVYLIGYKENGAYLYNANTENQDAVKDVYMTNTDQIEAAFSKITYTYTEEYCNRGAAFTLMMRDVELRQVTGKFLFQVINGNTTVGPNYFSELDACAVGNINYTEIVPSAYSYIYASYPQKVANAIAATKGLNLIYGATTSTTIYNHIVDNVAPPTLKYSVLIPISWESIILDDILSPDNNVDTDDDNLTDWNEVDTDSGLIAHDNT